MAKSPLEGLRIVEMGAIGPAPFCGMHFADLGADVILVEREQADPSQELTSSGPILRRGKRSVALNLKEQANVAKALSIIATADGLIEGMRPGVMERLGLGPEVCLAANPKLVYGRITGWGQTGPLSQTAGHDLNYVGVSGAAWFSGTPDGAPSPPPTLIGDVGGGALYLMIGMLSGILRARDTGAGDVIDAAIVDGSAHLMNLLLDVTLRQSNSFERGKTLLDGAHFYRVYQCADGKYLSVACLEPKFYETFLELTGLQGYESLKQQFAKERWQDNTAVLTALFRTKSRDEWCSVFEGSDACVGPVLSPGEASANPHMLDRNIYTEEQDYLQARPAPRFQMSGENSPIAATPRPGEHTEEILNTV